MDEVSRELHAPAALHPDKESCSVFLNVFKTLGFFLAF
jgi:hypothetical protein